MAKGKFLAQSTMVTIFAVTVAMVLATWVTPKILKQG